MSDNMTRVGPSHGEDGRRPEWYHATLSIHKIADMQHYGS